ncbi:MAG: hypothetical protein II893_03140 [Methanomicrobium sp.]|nr:hypothetical protein [Methanomicrobium sp.]
MTAHAGRHVTGISEIAVCVIAVSLGQREMRLCLRRFPEYPYMAGAFY